MQPVLGLVPDNPLPDPPGPATVLSIGIVCYQPDPSHFSLLLRTLAQAVSALQEHGHGVQVLIVDHGQQLEFLTALCAPYQHILQVQWLSNSANPGFGAGHNLALQQVQSQYHLILNPDVVLPGKVLLDMLGYAIAHPEIVALSPEVRDERGQLQYLCKTLPSVLDLALRGFAPAWLRRRFAARLARYECREVINARRSVPVALISGCFMWCRTDALRACGGFDEGYFLYFEDFALSRELQARGVVAYFPDVYIVHFGGHAASKGLAHIRYFVASAFRYFNHYGWRLW